MKTDSLIDYEKLPAPRIPPVVFDCRVPSLFRSHVTLLLEAAIFSRDGPSSCCK